MLIRPMKRQHDGLAQPSGGRDGWLPRYWLHCCSPSLRGPHEDGLMRSWRADSLCLRVARSRNYPMLQKSPRKEAGCALAPNTSLDLEGDSAKDRPNEKPRNRTADDDGSALAKFFSHFPAPPLNSLGWAAL